MINLGNFFPEDIKKQFAKNNINIGSALLVRISEITVKYPKYIIIVSENNKKDIFAYVIINTNINNNIFPTPYLKSLHVKIDKTNHNFLKYDSFVDCSKISEFTQKEIMDFVIQNPERVVGTVSENILKKIHNTITTAKTIEPHLKKKFGFL